MSLKVSGVKTADDLRKTLASLYKQRLEAHNDKRLKMSADVHAAKAGVLEFLIKELERMEFID